MNLRELFYEDSYDKQLNIATDSATYTNEDLQSENLELSEKLCSEESLRFGCCEASVFKIRILNNVISLKDKWITVFMTVSGNEAGKLTLGKYKVDSDQPTADRRYRDIVAYDAMYDIITADVADWYNKILPDAASKVTLKEFRTSFLAYFGIEQEEVSLVNDALTVTRTIEPSKLSGKTVITAICEINGCFGHIGRDGKFQYIFLKEMIEGLYPSDTLYPADDLYPADPINVSPISKGHYISAQYEDFTTARINKLQIRQEEDDIGYIYGDGDNCYVIQDNFLLYGRNIDDLKWTATNLYEVIRRVWYRPAHVEAKGNPCLEVGAGIKLHTTYEVIYTYILQRTLKGIQALRDAYDAEGEQYQRENVNSVHESIIQLKGKTNKLKRTIDETKSELSDIDRALSTRIVQNAESIRLEAERAIGQEVELAAAIRISADAINAEVTRSSAAEGELAAKISLNAQQILLKVSKDGIISSINQTAEAIKIQAQKIDLVGLVSANEFVSKFATIDTLNATKATLENLIANKASIRDLEVLNLAVSNLQTDKLSASQFTAENISAMNITVRSANVTGGFNASKITAGTLSVDRLDVDGLISELASKTIQCVDFAARSIKGSSYQYWDGSSYVNLSALLVTINGVSYRLMGYIP